jgi:hypothetical protein
MKIDFDSTDNTITVDGVRISLELLRCLANPDQYRLYTFVREGEIVICRTFVIDADSALLSSRSGAMAN